MLIIRGGINSRKRELCPTALILSAFYYNKNKHADTYIMYLHAYSTSVPNGHRFTDNIKPRDPNSPTSAIEHRADADSDSGFARLCFVQRCHKGTHTKVLQIVFRDADMTRGVLQTWKDTDHRRCKHPAG